MRCDSFEAASINTITVRSVSRSLAAILIQNKIRNVPNYNCFYLLGSSGFKVKTLRLLLLTMQRPVFSHSVLFTRNLLRSWVDMNSEDAQICTVRHAHIHMCMSTVEMTAVFISVLSKIPPYPALKVIFPLPGSCTILLTTQLFRLYFFTFTFHGPFFYLLIFPFSTSHYPSFRLLLFQPPPPPHLTNKLLIFTGLHVVILKNTAWILTFHSHILTRIMPPPSPQDLSVPFPVLSSFFSPVQG